MKEDNIKAAQKDIDEALATVETLEKSIDSDSLSKNELKDKFNSLSQKVQEIEDILKKEGIL